MACTDTDTDWPFCKPVMVHVVAGAVAVQDWPPADARYEVALGTVVQLTTAEADGEVTDTPVGLAGR